MKNESVNLCRKKIRAPNGRVYTYWTIRWFDHSGKRHSKSLGKTSKLSKRQAEKLRQAKETELTASPGRRSISRAPVLGEFLDSYEAARKSELGRGTFILHQQTRRYLECFFGSSRRIDSLTRADARSFKAALSGGKLVGASRRAKNLKPVTVDLHIRNARTVFSTALTDDLILFNPFDRLPQATAVPRDWHYVSLAEFGRILEAASNPSWRTTLALARLAGLRRGEALNLHWHQIDWDQSRLRVISHEGWTVKDKEPRTIPLGQELAAHLLARFESAGEGETLVIPKNTINVKNMSRDFAVICKRAGVQRYTKPLHTLRKSCLTDWAGRFPSHVVMQWSGHADDKTLREYYLKVSESEYDRAAETQLGYDLTQILTQIGNFEQSA